MNDDKSTNDWLKDWSALQRQYLNAWSDFTHNFPQGQTSAGAQMGGLPPFNVFAAPASSAQPAWQEGLGSWARTFADAGKQNETSERLIESAKGYMAMMQSLLGAAPTAANIDSPAQAWFDTARGAGGMNIPGFDPVAHPFAKALRDVVGKGARGFAELPAAFAPYIEQMRNEGLSWLRVPAFGLAREHQEHHQRTALAFFEYQQALREYNRLMLKAAQRGNELFEGKLAERGEPGRTIDSLKALYDVWVDAMEDAYAEVALSEEFSRAYGDLANAQMHVRKQIQIDVERMSREFGMPTRSELDSLSKQVHDLRRELRDDSASGDAGALGEELANLRSEVAALRKSLVQTSAKSATLHATASVAAVSPAAPSATVSRSAAKPVQRRAAPAKSRTPVAVVRPRPIDEGLGKAKSNSFADAVAAMRRRINDKPKARRAKAAQMAQPSKGDRLTRKGGKK